MAVRIDPNDAMRLEKAGVPPELQLAMEEAYEKASRGSLSMVPVEWSGSLKIGCYVTRGKDGEIESCNFSLINGVQ